MNKPYTDDKVLASIESEMKLMTEIEGLGERLKEGMLANEDMVDHHIQGLLRACRSQAYNVLTAHYSIED